MTPQQALADLLSGIAYPCRIPEETLETAEKHGLIIVYCVSDDLMEFKGAINNEVGVYGGGAALVCQDGIVAGVSSIDFSDPCTVNAVLDKDGYSWVIETEIPHATFEILEDGEKFCRGIVFSLADLQEKYRHSANAMLSGIIGFCEQDPAAMEYMRPLLERLHSLLTK